MKVSAHNLFIIYVSQALSNGQISMAVFCTNTVSPKRMMVQQNMDARHCGTKFVLEKVSHGKANTSERQGGNFLEAGLVNMVQLIQMFPEKCLKGKC